MRNFYYFSLIFLSVSVFSCKSDTKSETENVKSKASLQLIFNQKVGDDVFVMDEYKYHADAGYDYKIVTLRFFTSEFVLYDTSGNNFQLDTFHYREADEPHAYTAEMVLSDMISPDTYDGISFLHGLDETYNKPISPMDTPSLPNNVNEYRDMYWPWQEQGQFHYMKYEGFYAAGQDTFAFKLHSGPTKGNQNYIKIDKLDFPSTTINAGDTLVVELIMDVDKWVNNDIVYDFKKYGSGIMDNQEAQDILKSNGKSVYSVGKVYVKKNGN
ncbi:MAG: MbnP family protein [Saprospiraceae bacterium]